MGSRTPDPRGPRGHLGHAARRLFLRWTRRVTRRGLAWPDTALPPPHSPLPPPESSVSARGSGVRSRVQLPQGGVSALVSLRTGASTRDASARVASLGPLEPSVVWNTGTRGGCEGPARRLGEAASGLTRGGVPAARPLGPSAPRALTRPFAQSQAPRVQRAPGLGQTRAARTPWRVLRGPGTERAWGRVRRRQEPPSRCGADGTGSTREVPEHASRAQAHLCPQVPPGSDPCLPKVKATDECSPVQVPGTGKATPSPLLQHSRRCGPHGQPPWVPPSVTAAQITARHPTALREGAGSSLTGA